MARRANKASENALYNEKQQSIMNEAVKQVMKEGGLKFLTESHLKEAMRLMMAQFINAALQGEMDHHLQEEQKQATAGPVADDAEGDGCKNKRNGSSNKTVHSEMGDMAIQVPRDRNASFTPILLPKHARRFHDFDEAIIDLYSRGMSTREISQFIEKQYAVEVSAEFISTVTERVSVDVKEWQNRPLDSVYPVVFFDALRVNIRRDGVIKKMAVHLALGVRCDGRRDVLGMWFNENEGASFWTGVFTELKNRGVDDIIIAVTDGLKGMTQALEAVFPKALHQTCIVHLIRASTAFISYRDRPEIMAKLKAIYKANNAEEAFQALEELEASEIGKRCPHVAKAWRSAWPQVVPFFDFPKPIRKLLYTTNSIEALNRGIRKIIKTRTMFPNEDSAKRLVFLTLKNIQSQWVLPSQAWSAAMPVFAAMFGERFTGTME